MVSKKLNKKTKVVFGMKEWEVERNRPLQGNGKKRVWLLNGME